MAKEEYIHCDVIMNIACYSSVTERMNKTKSLTVYRLIDLILSFVCYKYMYKNKNTKWEGDICCTALCLCVERL